jgi:serine/threonine protein kinase/tetratricopeptide (TPR) repeat protein
MNDSQHVEDASAEALMGEIVDEFLDRVNRGERPEVEEYAARHPEFATVLRQMLPALQLLRSSGHVGQVANLPDGEPEETLGDFRLVREVGRGGMGVVYEAEQISLDRRVALKVLPFASTLDSRQLQRFKNEAQAAACLHHTNIVPVFATGVERGVHYYAMQFIDGHTLAQVIAGLREGGLGYRDLPRSQAPLGNAVQEAPLRCVPPGRQSELEAELPAGRSQAELGNEKATAIAALSTLRSTKPAQFYRTIAELGIQAAEALEYAHQMGIVHRDIKPANLLLEDSGLSTQDSALRLWITDFGLAQIQNETTRLTMTGDLLGTLRYMSPEQALAKNGLVDHRTDIYSLGVTLYELLSLTPAFDGKGRQEVLRQIAFEEPKPLRKINNAIPAEVETIVLKMMEKEVNSRYATAKEAADDFQRFLLHEPIKAKRPSLVQRVRKWSHRHPSVVVSSVVALILAVVSLAVSNVLITRERNAKEDALRDKAAALEEARQEQQRASVEAATATQLADFLLGLFQASDPIESGDLRHPDDVGKKVPASVLLDRAAERIDTEFTGPALTKATLLDAIGNVYRNLGIYDKSQSLLERGLAIRTDRLSPNHPDIATSLLHLGQLHQHLADYEKAEPLLRRALAIRETHFGPAHLAVAEAKYQLGWLLHDMQNDKDAETLLREVVEIRTRKLGGKNPQTALARALLVVVLVHMNKDVDALQNSLVAFDASDAVKATLAFQRAVQNRRQHNYEESEKAYREMLAIFRRDLSDSHPAVVLVLADMAGMLREKGDMAGAESAVREGIALGNKVMPGHPMVIFMRQEYAKGLLAHDRHAEAEIHLLDNLHALKKGGAKKQAEIRVTLELLVRLYEAWNKPAQAAEQREALAKLLNQEPDEKKSGK